MPEKETVLFEKKFKDGASTLIGKVVERTRGEITAVCAVFEIYGKVTFKVADNSIPIETLNFLEKYLKDNHPEDE